MGENDKLVYSVTEAAEALSIGRTLIYDLIRTGELRTLKIGHRRLVARADLDEFVARLQGKESAA